MQQCDPQTSTTDQEEQYDANNSVSFSNEKSSDTIIVDKEEGSEFQEGGIRGWATVVGA